MCLIFDILETLFESCNEALLSPNKSWTAKSLGVHLILETRRQVQIAYWEAKLSAIHLALIVEPATNFCFCKKKDRLYQTWSYATLEMLSVIR